MSSPSSPSGLPFLPGYSFDVQPKTSFHRAQKFAVVNGVRVHDIDHGKNAEIQRAAKAVMEKEWSKELKQLEETKRKVENNVETAWIDQGRGVLRFFAFFKEAVHSSPLENFRVRKCTLYYFLEDKTICITEPRQDNSGLPQGVFTKRHQVPKDDVNFYGIDDLFVGAELHIYGRVFRLVDCDAFTRGFYQQKGKELAPSEEYPVDPFAVHTQQKVRTSFNKTMNPLKAFMEASMGRSMGVNVEVTKQFLANDRKVLRFYCLWDDPSMYGDKRKYVMHYYLADDTVEVLEILPPNSGRDPFPALLKRSKLPQNYSKTVANVATIGSPVVNEFYTDADLHIGSMINVFGRELLLCGCDKYTQQFYMKNYGMKEEDLTTLDVDEPGKEWPKMEVPPYTGFGTEEDSLGSFTHLVPKVPRKDFKKLMQNDGQNLRFLAKFSHPVIEDVERRFILTYFLADDTISIFEKVERNSGFVGGKFLERSRVKRSDTQQYLQPSEFFVGAVLPINNFDFELVEADEYTYQYMEEHQQQFPKSSPSCVANELKRQGLSKETFSALEEAWKAADSNCDNTVDKSEFKNMLMKAGYQLSEHEFQTILRKFDKNGDGRIDYKEFASTLL